MSKPYAAQSFVLDPSWGPGILVPPDVVAAFLARRVEGTPDQCWPHSPNSRSYGHVVIPYAGRIKAHRLAWMIHHQKPVPCDLVVRHRCNNPACCNPLHLSIGTHLDNYRDRFRVWPPRPRYRDATV